MNRPIAALLMLAGLALPARAHFVWIVPAAAEGDRATAQIFFSDALTPDSPDLLPKIAHSELFVRDAVGKTAPVKWEKGKEAYEVVVPGSGPRTLAAVCRYGVIQRGSSEPFLLHYHAKAFLGFSHSERTAGMEQFHKGLDKLVLDIVPVEREHAVVVLWQGKPLADAAVVLTVPGVEKPLERKTDKAGRVAIELPASAGLYGIRARHVEAKAGELDGKKYKEVRHYATLVVRFAEGDIPRKAGDDKADSEAVKADPAATALLTAARAARAQWEKFPGFRADVEINTEGQVVRGKVEVSPKGKVTVQVPEAEANREAAEWAQRQLASLAAHRLDNSATLNTPCAFADDNKEHPLGRAIRVLDDEFHSSYRVRDSQILVVNRRMADSRFTITVTENRLNEEKKYLPVSYVVNTWDLKTDVLKSSATHHHTWQRVRQFDLPVTLTVVTASAGKQEARQIRLSGHELLP